MEQPIPDWLDKDFLAQCLRSEEGKHNIEVTNFIASRAVPAGNNYGACVARVKVEYKESKEDQQLQTISLIVKSEVTEGPLKDILEAQGKKMQLKEPSFYQRFLPAVSKLSNTDFAPKTFSCPKPTVTVMEDLKEQGFMMADRLKQLDFDHCRLYMEAAASFHAVSLAVHKKDPELIESVGEDAIFTNPKVVEMLKIIKKNGFEQFADEICKIEKHNKYHKLVEGISENLWVEMEKVYKPCSTLNTLTQGDPWTTNMMFKYDDKGAVKEVKLLDFQGVRYLCPINDVIFFIWSSATHDVRRNRLNDLYGIYLDAFNLKLQELNCSERMTFNTFMDIIKELSYFTIFLVVTHLPFFCNSEPADFSALATPYKDSERNPYDKLYTESFRNNHLPKVLDELELAGVFEYLENHKK